MSAIWLNHRDGSHAISKLLTRIIAKLLINVYHYHFYTLYMFYTAETLFVYLVYFVVPDLPVHNPPIPQPLPEVPAETGEAVKKAELEKVADAEVGEGAKIARQFVILRLAWIGPDTRFQALHCLLRFALGVAAMLFLPPLQRIEVIVIEHNQIGRAHV